MVQAKRGIEVPIYWTTCGNAEEHHVRFIMSRVLFLHSLLLLPLDSYIMSLIVLFIFKNTLHLSK